MQSSAREPCIAGRGIDLERMREQAQGFCVLTALGEQAAECMRVR